MNSWDREATIENEPWVMDTQGGQTEIQAQERAVCLHCRETQGRQTEIQAQVRTVCLL